MLGSQQCHTTKAHRAVSLFCCSHYFRWMLAVTEYEKGCQTKRALRGAEVQHRHPLLTTSATSRLRYHRALLKRPPLYACASFARRHRTAGIVFFSHTRCLDQTLSTVCRALRAARVVVHPPPLAACSHFQHTQQH
jgi:hypothetical protein